ncbi:MAG TPA: GNAT family N-acetyltransferase [Actinopolymorphaceae bacterium]|jgi:GNAT superfamily N-acetyltransferase
MDAPAVLAAFDQQIRRRPESDAGGGRIERADGIVRSVSDSDGWNGVTWSDLDDATADAAIAAQIARFGRIARSWEWKYYSYDAPMDLPARLVAAGFGAEPAEALLVAEIPDLDLDTTAPPGIELRPVVDEHDADALVSVGDEVFGADHAAIGRHILAGVAQSPPTIEAVVAWARITPVSAARVECNAGTDFAGLSGGGTLPSWRGRGVFRSLVAHRAALAAARGFRYLQVDASSDSRPILKRLGFVQLANTTPFVHQGARG